MCFRKFLSYCWGTAACRGETFKQVVEERDKVVYGFAAVMLLSTLYSIAVLIGFVKGVSPTGYEPFLRIPLESYYLWQTFFTIPVGLIGWVLFAGAAQLLARSLCGQGSFEDNLAVLGLPFVLMLPFSWLPEITVTFLVPEWFGTPIWEAVTPFRVGVSVLWFLIASTVAVRQVQNLSVSRAILVTFVSFVPTICVQITYLH
jgi:hypothetical protein